MSAHLAREMQCASEVETPTDKDYIYPHKLVEEKWLETHSLTWSQPHILHIHKIFISSWMRYTVSTGLKSQEPSTFSMDMKIL
jgi:hypothetical protein